MKIYNYSQFTNEFLSVSQADESPLEPGVYLIPSNATAVPKIESVPAFKTQIFNIDIKTWQLIDNWRGVELFDKNTYKKVFITELGVKPSDIGATEVEPPDTLHSWQTDHWVIDPIKVTAAFKAKQYNKINLISADCKAAIYAGFYSSALGSIYHYPANDIDQQNLTASVLASLLPGLSPEWTTPFWCADSEGVWDYRLHTAAQIQLVGRVAKAAVLASTIKNATLAAAVLALPETASQADFDAIVW